MARDTYGTRRRKRPAIRKLGESPEALSRKMKPAGTMGNFPKRKVSPRKGITKLRAAERAVRGTVAGKISMKIFGRAIPALGAAMGAYEVGRAGVEGYKAFKAYKELRDLETALNKKSRKEK